MRLEMHLKFKKKKKKKLLMVSLVLAFFSAITVKIFINYLRLAGYEIKVNVTSSLPGRLWWINNRKITDFKKGDYFIFYAPNDKMLTNGESTPLLKMVAATAGDVISFNKTSLLINGVVSGHVWPKTIKGDLLHPIESQTITQGCYFAWTPALYSYDSRYTDIRIVCEKDQRIIGSATSLF